MKNLFAIFLFALALSAYAKPENLSETVKLNFDRVPVIQLINVVYGDILKENFVLHPALANSDLLVTVQFQSDVDKRKVHQFMLSFLNSVGIAVQDRNGYVFLLPLKEKDQDASDDELFFYRPKYRTVSYISDLSASLFKHGKFTSQRGIKSNINATTKQHADGSAGAVDNGTNAYSQQDKSEVDAFVFSGTAKEVAMLQKLLTQIDVPVGEVIVKGVVYEVTTTTAEGSAFALVSSLLGQRFGVNIGQGVSGDSVSISTPNFSAVLGVLNSDSRFKSINNASMRVKSGSTGVLSVGSNVPVLGSVIALASGATQQSVSYQPSGVIFNLSPTVRDASVDLVIDEQISSFVNTTTGVNGSPTLIKRQIMTTVGASNDDVILLGGLDQANDNKGSTGAGFLPAFFRSRSGDATKTEVLLVLNVHKI